MPVRGGRWKDRGWFRARDNEGQVVVNIGRRFCLVKHLVDGYKLESLSWGQYSSKVHLATEGCQLTISACFWADLLKALRESFRHCANVFRFSPFGCQAMVMVGVQVTQARDVDDVLCWWWQRLVGSQTLISRS